MKYGFYILLILVFFETSSCNYFKLKSEKGSDEVLARVGDEKLYKSDLLGLYQPNMTTEDSAMVTNNFIDNWARRQIILQKAKFNLTSDEEAEIKKMVNQYEEDLFINSYKAALTSQNMDSVLTDTELKDFYTKNNQLFNLNEDVLRYRMISFQSDDKNAEKMKELFKKKDSVSTSELLKGEYLFQGVQLNDTVWIKFNDFIKKYPFAQNLNKEQLLQSNHIQELKTGNITNYIFVKSALKRGEVAPFQFVKDDISKMILHQKKLKYIQDIENKLIQEAIQNQKYEKYIP